MSESTNVRHVLLRSDAFAVDRPDDTLDAWFAGADLAGWLYDRMLWHRGIGPAAGPTMASWGGWSMRLVTGRRRVPVTVQCFSPQQRTWYLQIGPARARWLAWRAVDRAQALATVRVAVETVLADPRIVAVRWLDRDPWSDGGEPALLDPRDAAPGSR